MRIGLERIKGIKVLFTYLLLSDFKSLYKIDWIMIIQNRKIYIVCNYNYKYENYCIEREDIQAIERFEE